MLPSTCDVAVIGGGIVGLATARAVLAARPRSLLVLEAEPRIASHQTGHNSGVIHSGLYYAPGSRKARDCVAGRAALVRYLEQRAIAHQICGKVVVATQDDELEALARLEERGLANGLEGVRRMTPDEMREREPHVRGVAGLWVPQTGITDYRVVAESFAKDVIAGGGAVFRDARLLGVRHAGDEVILETTLGATRAGLLVNCAGLQCDRVARMCGLTPKVRIIPFRGEYYRLSDARAELVRTLIYPVPDPRFPFLGVHFTRRISGEVECGPNAVLALRREGYRRRDVSLRDTAELLVDPAFWRLASVHWRMGVAEEARSLSKARFVASLQELVPEITGADLSRYGSGVRAQAVADDGSLLDDFHIERTANQIHVLNAPSPAATASLAIGAEIARQIDA